MLRWLVAAGIFALILWAAFRPDGVGEGPQGPPGDPGPSFTGAPPTTRAPAPEPTAEVVADDPRLKPELEKWLLGLIQGYSDADSVRLGASRALLDNLLRFRDSEELSDRVRQLEQAITPVGFNGTAL